MILSEDMLLEFFDDIKMLDNRCSAARSCAKKESDKVNNRLKKKSEKNKQSVRDSAIGFAKVRNDAVEEAMTTEENRTEQYLQDHKEYYANLQRCALARSRVNAAESVVSSFQEYSDNCQSVNISISFPVDDLLNDTVDFWNVALNAREAISSSRKPRIQQECSKLYCMCRTAEEMLDQYSLDIRKRLITEKSVLTDEYHKSRAVVNTQLDQLSADCEKWYLEELTSFCQSHLEDDSEFKDSIATNEESMKAEILRIELEFLEKYPYKAMAQEYEEIMANEPCYSNYSNAVNLPQRVRLGTFRVDVSLSGLKPETVIFLEKYYSFMFKDNCIFLPDCLSFMDKYNYIFEYEGNTSSLITETAFNIGMRLFTMLPPGRIKFTFLDPVALGSSFATFARLVDLDDRSSEVINGQIWSSQKDIEAKLQIMADHISSITQRCLQGKYTNLYQYNKDAELNPEAYQVMMLMDYPAGLTESSIRLLEQISSSGPKCGVFVLLFKSSMQCEKVSRSSSILLDNLESHFKKIKVSPNGKMSYLKTDSSPTLIWQEAPHPTAQQQDVIIEELRKGIKGTNKVVIGVEKISKAEASDSTLMGIRVPIGMYGANSVQYLTLGTGGSHHALIAGVSGSGKSNLLHTIIINSLQQYSSDELEIYLVDFKRGVEFKIYADYRLPQFKVIAIESEKEFGYNILKEIERQQKIRARLFKSIKEEHVDFIEQYRSHGYKMPRILVILDEFHELFSDSSEYSKESAELMERIVRQGRGFGVHLILSSQTYSNVNCVKREVFEQMAVRIVLKCPEPDANMLLSDGASLVNQISLDDAGRAIYNSEGGAKEFSNMFKVVYINPSNRCQLLSEVSNKYAEFPADTRILLTNIEDNSFSFFNRFDADDFTWDGSNQIYIGEPLSINGNINFTFSREAFSNLILVGNNDEIARNIFSYALLSICINYWLSHRKAPEKPVIYLLNCKPLMDSFFEDIPSELAKMLDKYISVVPFNNQDKVTEMLKNMHKSALNLSAEEQYLFIFGYQRAEHLKSNVLPVQNSFTVGAGSEETMSPRKMLGEIIRSGPQNGVHTVIWQSHYRSLANENNDFISLFNMRIGFNMPEEDVSLFLADDITPRGDNAVFYDANGDTSQFRPYQDPSMTWIEKICDIIKD